jgi:plasmid stability protein
MPDRSEKERVRAYVHERIANSEPHFILMADFVGEKLDIPHRDALDLVAEVIEEIVEDPQP